MTSIDADQVWRQDNYTVTNSLFRISESSAARRILVNTRRRPYGGRRTYKCIVSWQANVTQELDNLETRTSRTS